MKKADSNQRFLATAFIFGQPPGKALLISSDFDLTPSTSKVIVLIAR